MHEHKNDKPDDQNMRGIDSDQRSNAIHNLYFIEIMNVNETHGENPSHSAIKD